MQFNKQALFHLSVFTLIGMPCIAFLILHFLPDTSFLQVLFDKGKSIGDILRQIGVGLGIGVLVSIPAIILIRLSPFKKVNAFFSDLMIKLDPKLHHILFYSLCAGVGEEMLFRGAFQQWIGIWPTAILFVFLHGYLSPKNIPLTIYGVFLVFVASGFGYMTKISGIFSAMTAHFVYDVVMFCYLRWGRAIHSPTKQD